MTSTHSALVHHYPFSTFLSCLAIICSNPQWAYYCQGKVLIAARKGRIWGKCCIFDKELKVEKKTSRQNMEFIVGRLCNLSHYCFPNTLTLNTTIYIHTIYMLIFTHSYNILCFVTLYPGDAIRLRSGSGSNMAVTLSYIIQWLLGNLISWVKNHYFCLYLIPSTFSSQEMIHRKKKSRWSNISSCGSFWSPFRSKKKSQTCWVVPLRVLIIPTFLSWNRNHYDPCICLHNGTVKHECERKKEGNVLSMFKRCS